MDRPGELRPANPVGAAGDSKLGTVDRGTKPHHLHPWPMLRVPRQGSSTWRWSPRLCFLSKFLRSRQLRHIETRCEGLTTRNMLTSMCLRTLSLGSCRLEEVGASTWARCRGHFCPVQKLLLLQLDHLPVVFSTEG